jgi:phosphatidate cytidylyltransferase
VLADGLRTADIAARGDRAVKPLSTDQNGRSRVGAIEVILLQAVSESIPDAPNASPLPPLKLRRYCCCQFGHGAAGAGRDDPVWLTTRTFVLLAVILVALSIATLVAVLMSRRENLSVEAAMLQRFNHKLRVWWMMTAILVIGFLLHFVGTVLLFGLVSFWALREFVTMTPTRRADHRTLFWVFFIFLPLQYLLVLFGSSPPRWLFGDRDIDFYGLYSIFIPVYASLFIPARIALSGDSKRFLERSAIIQAGLLICVYSLSYAPALLDLRSGPHRRQPWMGSNLTLLIFMLLIAQLASVLERFWSRLAGRWLLAERINASRTWEGCSDRWSPPGWSPHRFTGRPRSCRGKRA